MTKSEKTATGCTVFAVIHTFGAVINYSQGHHVIAAFLAAFAVFLVMVALFNLTRS